MASNYIDKEIILIALKSISNTLEVYIDTEKDSAFYEDIKLLKEDTDSFIQSINTQEAEYIIDTADIINKYSEIDNQYLRLIFCIRDEKIKIVEEKEIENTEETKEKIDAEVESGEVKKVEEEVKEVHIDEEKAEEIEKTEKVEENIEEKKEKRVLIISEQDSKVYLPYTEDEIVELLENKVYKTREEALAEEFTIELSRFKNPLKSRFAEAYYLSKEIEHQSRMESLRLGFELMTKYNLHPAIIAACRNIDELDIYLDCLEENELDKFDIFDIRYVVAPMILTNNEGAKRRRAV